MEKKPRTKKRIVPVLNVNIENNEYEKGFNALLAKPEVRSIVLCEVVNAINEGINTNKKESSLFKLDHSEYAVTIKQAAWKISLNTALNYYAEKEDYLMCAKCRDLINKL